MELIANFNTIWQKQNHSWQKYNSKYEMKTILDT